MHMNSAPHLLPEDRPEFERALEEALRTASQRPALTGLGERLTARQLRTMALSAASAIAACAAAEYEHFVGLRSELRRPRHAPPSGGPATGAGSTPDGQGPPGGSLAGDLRGGPLPGAEAAGTDTAAAGGDGKQMRGGGLSLAGALGDGLGEAAGAGLLAMASVLVPMLAGTAAVIFLLLGYLLHVMSPEPAIAAPMRGAGWVFAALAAAGIVVGMAELWLTALRNGAGARAGAAADAALTGEADGRAGLAEEVAEARAAWREALLERGIVPFLAEALADPVGSQAPVSYAPVPEPDASHGADRTPRLGYSHPEFSSRTPSDGTEERSVRPRYSSPDYSSPDYGGPEHPPE